MPIPLETARLIIRSFRTADLEAFMAYRNEPEVARYQGWGVPYPREMAVAFIDEMKDRTDGTPGQWLQLAVELKSTMELIGDWAFFIMKNDNQQAYLGYTLAGRFWGQGYATEATHRVLRHLFDELNLHRVVAECDVENTASIKLLEQIGFRREAHLIENVFFKGAYTSEYHYAMLKREWDLRKHA